MAEIRKHNPDRGNAIARALQDAMGEPVRPLVPGEDPATARSAAQHSASAPSTAGATTWVSLSFVTTTVPVADDEDQD